MILWYPILVSNLLDAYPTSKGGRVIMKYFLERLRTDADFLNTLQRDLLKIEKST